MIWDYLLKGLCHGAYVIGLLGSISIIVVLIGTFIGLFGYVAGTKEEEAKNDNRYR